MSTDTIAPKSESKIPKAVVEPLIDENGAQMHVSVGTVKLPLTRVTVPEHKRKKDGVEKTVPEAIRFDIDYSQPILVAQAALFALESVASGEDRIVLAERIFGGWIDQASQRGYVPDPTNPGETIWDERAMAKDLVSPRAQRKAGTSIDDLRKERDHANAILVPVLEFIVDIKSGKEPDWALVKALVGQDFNREAEALIEFQFTLKEKRNALNAAIKVKEEAMAKAKVSREQKKKSVVAKTETAAEPVTA